MSTKTTFKRIALATVATLGFGILSVVPSHAAGMLADSLLNAADGTSVVASSATLNGTAPTAKIVWSGVATGASDTATLTGTILSVPATSGVWQVGFAATPDITVNKNSVFGSNTITADGASGRVTKYITASFTPDVSGTYVIALKSAGGVNNSTVTWTITVAATPAATAAASTVSFSTDVNQLNVAGNVNYLHYNLNYTSTESKTAAFATTADASANADGKWYVPVTAASANLSPIASGLVTFSNKTVLAANTAIAVPMTVSISGHGYVRIVNFVTAETAYGTTVTETADNGYTPFGVYGKVKGFQVISDGTSGPATVTVSAGGVVLGTADIVFTGPKKSLALGTTTATKLSKNYIGSGEEATVTVNALDAAGNILSAADAGITTASVTSSDATGAIASATVVDNVVHIVGGLVSGTVTWTVKDADKNTVTFVTKTTKKTGTFVLSFDAASYGPGEKVTWKVTGTDSNGSPVADGVRNAFGSVSANMALVVGSLPDTSPAFVDGVATGSFYAPATSSGTFNVSTTIGAADATFATATEAAKAVKTVSSFAITNAPVDAATDAANEATDAANAATDAALAAADAADAATSAAQDASDAVAALSATVAKLMASLKAQLTSLTNLVIKIQKKVKA